MEDNAQTLERAECLQNLLIASATGGAADGDEYKILRKLLLDTPDAADLVPSFVRKSRDLGQFWGFIKYEYAHYAERREFIWSQFAPLLDHLEERRKKPADAAIGEALRSFDADGVHSVWTKALARRATDAEGAITVARTLLETVCKHILDAAGVTYDRNKIDLPELYRLTSQELNLGPSQHTQDTFKKILGGITSVVNELGSLRNRLGDAHGQGKRQVRPGSRHAELAVNLAGAVALFLIDTWRARQADALQNQHD